ncbi:MAG: Polyribonucleotide nucleotidyltransferase (EC [uncultured Campylobacterales bacterium]|uniref:Polyribonucleotide nucleotidyltransferase n=1 Tax=uncultured Campylobacterales bacterium TaxID=352960 RepID=A0A6S6SQ04_9BACT|nr:MAG: Polyribonucleotide nucleotidyltransferase (EC [uncultured Campylobacterales bacterium]
MKKTINLDINNQNQIFEFDYMAKQANGSVLLKIKNAVILATVCVNQEKIDGDFVPLTVQYIEKAYAARKIPGGFIKREGKPGDFETLTSRIIDRSLRPLFNENHQYSTQITLLVLSSDNDVDMQTMALNAASTALYVSDIPVNKAVYAIRVGKVGNEYVINPTNIELSKSSLDLYVTGTKDELLMIEMRSLSTIENGEQLSNEIENEEMINILDIATININKAAKNYEDSFQSIKKTKIELDYQSTEIDEEQSKKIKQDYYESIKNVVVKMAKSESATEIKALTKQIATTLDMDIEDTSKIVATIKREIVRSLILEQDLRIDGRGLKEIRKIDIDTNILPNTHGSCLFTRGETQALATITLGGDQDAQMFESLTQSATQYEKFMLHYNFPGFSVGEASRIFGVGRRELGHGNLGKRALAPFISSEYAHTVRVVSEILESNGSSSQATICAASLALKCAGVDTSKLVAGIAMGLITDGKSYKVLSDIMGIEDHEGDMDFKIAGSKDGISAMQMDIKLGGVSKEVLRDALIQASEGKLHILEIMEEAKEKIVLNNDLIPSLKKIKVHPTKIAAIIGRGGETIKKLIEKYNVNIDIDRDTGSVSISSESSANVENCIEEIQTLIKSDDNRPNKRFDSKSPRPQTPKFEIDSIIDGTVKKIVDFGAFIQIAEGTDGLLHSSKMKDVKLNVDDKIKVKIISQENHKVGLDFAPAEKKKVWKIF